MFSVIENFVWARYFIALAIPLCAFLLWYSILNIARDMPGENREYFDPLPLKLKIIWPLVNFFAYYIGQNFSVDFLEKYAATMKRAGVSYLMTPEQFIGLRFVGAMTAGILCCLSLLMSQQFDWVYPVAAMVLGYYLPLIALRDMRSQRERQIVRALPTYLDYLTLSVQAGLNMSSAIAKTAEKAAEGPLKIEFLKLIRDMRAGMGRADAMKAMSDRLAIGAISTFISAVVQAEKTGADLGLMLKAQADQRRTERFQRAEKRAMQAPVKLIAPLVIFIFPITFLIIFFPIGVKLFNVF